MKSQTDTKPSRECEIAIDDLAFGGRGVGKKDGLVVFVDGALPDQVVRARITKKKRTYAEAKLLEVLTRSPQEHNIPWQEIPGAPWARLPVATQMEYKLTQVKQLFREFAGVELDGFLDRVETSPQPWEYRNKVEYSFGTDAAGGFALGFKARGQFSIVEGLHTPSGLFDEAFEKAVPNFAAWCEASGLPPYDPVRHTGFFRHLTVRKSFTQDSFLITLSVTSEGERAFDKEVFVHKCRELFGARVTGIFLAVKDGHSDSSLAPEWCECLWGEAALSEEISGLGFRISRTAFFQPNSRAAEILYSIVQDYAQLSPGRWALDLYCGCGTIAQVLARAFPEAFVKGVELEPAAVADARENATRNNLTNVTFECADVRAFLKQELRRRVVPGLVVLDPPRAGMVPKALARIIEMQSDRMIYVSCNPATMARDVQQMLQGGYRLRKFSVVDQFPHTAHVECVAMLERGK